MPYAIIVTSTEQQTDQGHVVTHDGDRFWVVEEEDNWVEATSVRYRDLGTIPRNIKVFATRCVAESFLKRWRGHPWWCSPRRDAGEILEIAPRYRKVVIGYRVLSGTE